MLCAKSQFGRKQLQQVAKMRYSARDPVKLGSTDGVPAFTRKAYVELASSDDPFFPLLSMCLRATSESGWSVTRCCRGSATGA